MPTTVTSRLGFWNAFQRLLNATLVLDEALASTESANCAGEFNKLSAQLVADPATHSELTAHATLLLTFQAVSAALPILRPDWSGNVSPWTDTVRASVKSVGGPSQLSRMKKMESLAPLNRGSRSKITDIANQLLSELLGDLVHHLRRTAGYAGYSARGAESKIRDFAHQTLLLDRVANAKPFGELQSAQQVMDKYPLIDAKKLHHLESHRYIISVKSWEGHKYYPSFQFVSAATNLGHKRYPNIRPDVSYALQGSSLAFSGWRATAWFMANGAGELSSISKLGAMWHGKLSQLGLWIEDWEIEASNDLDEFSCEARTIPEHTPLFRVKASQHAEPFSYAIAPPLSQLPSTNSWRTSLSTRLRNREAINGGGRFDPTCEPCIIGGEHHGLKGAVYLATEAIGAWTEVLDREPAVFLDDLLAKQLWRCIPAHSFEVVDATPLPAVISATPYRRATQRFALRVSQGKYDGIIYRCRSRVQCEAVAVFGTYQSKGGSHDPDWSKNTKDPTPGGQWDTRPFRYWESESSWQAAHDLGRTRAGHTVLLIRVPPD